MTDEVPLMRAPVVRIVDHGGSTTVIGPQVVRRFDGDSAALLRAVLEIHLRPTRRTQLLAALAVRAGPSSLADSEAPVAAAPEISPDRRRGGSADVSADAPAGVSTGTSAGVSTGTSAGVSAGVSIDALPVQPVDDLVALLVADGVLVPAREPLPPPPVGALRRVVLGISGAVAAIDAPAMIRGLHAAGCDVRVALTRNAARMVSRPALDALTHHAVWSGIWQCDASVPVPHVNLAEWAELVIVCPASATTLSRIATGDCSDLVAAIVAATGAPVIVVPSMNDAMYGSPAVQANLAVLREHGRYVVHPALGIEVAHQPHARAPLAGPAPPAGAVIEIVRHVLREAAARSRLPDTAHGWEQLWAATPAARLPWYTTALDPSLTAAIAAQQAPGRRLLDIGTGDGVVAIAAARCGFHVTALDIAPTALGRARERADRAQAHAIVFVLDDVTAPRLDDRFDVAVDRGVLHGLPAARWAAYAAGVNRLVAPGGTLLLVAHAPGAELGTHAVTPADLGSLLPSFALAHAASTTLAGAAAQLFELRRHRD